MRVNIKSNTILSGEDVRNVIDDLARKGIYTKKMDITFDSTQEEEKNINITKTDEEEKSPLF